MPPLQTPQPTRVTIVGTGRLSNPAILVPSEAFFDAGSPEFIGGDTVLLPSSTSVDVAEESFTIDPRISQVLSLLISEMSPHHQIMAIIAEPIENDKTIHITTFAHPLDEAAREATYDAEIKTIAAFSGMQFDFHLRAAEMKDGQVFVPVVPHALVLWHRP